MLNRILGKLGRQEKRAKEDHLEKKNVCESLTLPAVPVHYQMPCHVLEVNVDAVTSQCPTRPAL